MDLDGGLGLLTQAAESGVAEAAFELGQLLVQADLLDEGRPWLESAAEAGYAPALRMLGRMAAAAGESSEAAALLGDAANAGSPQAVYEELILLAQAGPTDILVRKLDGVLSRRQVPPGVVAEIGRATAERDPGAIFDLTVPITEQQLVARQAFADGLRRGNPDLMDEIGADIAQVLDL